MSLKQFDILILFFFLSNAIISPSPYIIVIDAEDGKTWNDANIYCISTYGTTLATVLTDEEANTLIQDVQSTSKPNGQMWLGLNDIQTEGIWVWADGTTCSSSCNQDYWNGIEPNNSGAGEDCGVLLPFNTLDNIFNDYPCDGLRDFICQAPDPTRNPTNIPSRSPTINPTITPTSNPTTKPSNNPTNIPSTSPTKNPTVSPTSLPTIYPTLHPSDSNTPTAEGQEGGVVDDVSTTALYKGERIIYVDDDDVDDNTVTIAVVASAVVLVLVVLIVILVIWIKKLKKKQKAFKATSTHNTETTTEIITKVASTSYNYTYDGVKVTNTLPPKPPIVMTDTNTNYTIENGYDQTQATQGENQNDACVDNLIGGENDIVNIINKTDIGGNNDHDVVNIINKTNAGKLDTTNDNSFEIIDDNDVTMGQ